jgi:hypothetical protein
MPEQTDEALLELAGRSETAFMLLFERYREVIFRVACRLTNSTAAAEDITQECFLGLLNASGRFDPAKGSLRTYLYGAVRNHARRYHGLRGGEVDLEDTEIDGAAEPSQVFLQQEQSQMIRQFHAPATATRSIDSFSIRGTAARRDSRYFGYRYWSREIPIAQGTGETQANSYTVLGFQNPLWNASRPD